MNFLYSFHSKSISKSIHMWLFSYSESDYFGEEELYSFFSHGLQAPETEACQNCQNN